MAFGFPAYAVERKWFEFDNQFMLDAILNTLKVLNWRCESVLPYEVIAKISVNIFSWGEKLTVSRAADGTLMARSEGVLPTQCIDWGKNERNVKRFFEELDRSVMNMKSLMLSQRPVEQFDQNGQTPIERVFGETQRSK